jgi:uncharacterized repeat protein (TIGR03803 family)
VALACAVVAWPLALRAADDAAPAPATGYAILHAFQVAEGRAPYGELVQAANGALYGTAYAAGPSSAGTVFRAWPGGKFSVLHAFSVADGQAPAGGLTIGNDGHLYGVTGGGGAYGLGTAFRLTPAGVFTLLHSFGGPAGDGAYPYLGALVLAADGNFYGTTMQGGAHGLGVAFRMTPAGAVTVLHAFSGGVDDGALPRAQLVAGSDGLLHGTTVCGGVPPGVKGCGGTLYTLSLGGAFAITHRFVPGDAPQAPLTEVGGLLYGTTSAGGTAHAGTVFKTTLDGRSFVTVHEFAPSALGLPRTAEGAAPLGKLLLARDGNLYGTTSQGGLHASTDPNGDGTVFRITRAGAYSVVQAFGASVDDGARPYGGLLQGQDGNLYGTTHNGANQSNGTVFRLALPAAQKAPG